MTTEMPKLHELVEFESSGIFGKSRKTYDESIKRLKKKRYDRHQRIQEFYSLLIGHYSQPPEEKRNNLVRTMIYTTNGESHEWLSLAFVRLNDIVTLYTDPEGISWQSKGLFKRGSYLIPEQLKFTQKKTFNIKGLTNEYYPLAEIAAFNKKLVKYLCTKPYNDLPLNLRKKTFLSFPNDGIVYPMSFFFLRSSSDLYFSSYTTHSYSRGVRAKTLNIPEQEETQ